MLVHFYYYNYRAPPAITACRIRCPAFFDNKEGFTYMKLYLCKMIEHEGRNKGKRKHPEPVTHDQCRICHIGMYGTQQGRPLCVKQHATEVSNDSI